MAAAVVMVIALGVKASFAQEECKKCEGTIKKVDCEAKTITCTVKEGDAEKEMACSVAEDAKITLNGNEAKLGDLKEGDKVSCEYVMKDDKMVAKTIAATRAGG
jgi:Cu/Ag efflux protein CusF